MSLPLLFSPVPTSGNSRRGSLQIAASHETSFRFPIERRTKKAVIGNTVPTTASIKLADPIPPDLSGTESVAQPANVSLYQKKKRSAPDAFHRKTHQSTGSTATRRNTPRHNPVRAGTDGPVTSASQGSPTPSVRTSRSPGSDSVP